MGRTTTLIVRQGDLVQVPKAVWHTQRTLKAVRLLFITPAGGTEHCASDQPPGS